MTNPKLTISSEGNLSPDPFVMIQGKKIDIQNDGTVEQTVTFSVANGPATNTITVPAGRTVSDIQVDFVAHLATSSGAALGVVPGTGVTVKQMSETGTKCGLGFPSGDNLARVVSNLGIAAIQVRLVPDANCSHEFLIHICSDGTLAITSLDAAGAYSTWSRTLGASIYPDVLKYSGDLQDTLFFTPTLVDNQLTWIADAHPDKQLVYDSDQGLCLKTNVTPQVLAITPVAFS